MQYNRLMLWTTVVLVCFGAVMARAGEQADDILKATGVQGGLIVHVGCGDGELTAELQAHGSIIVHGLDTDETNVQKARKHIAAKGQYGAVSVGEWGAVAVKGIADQQWRATAIRGSDFCHNMPQH